MWLPIRKSTEDSVLFLFLLNFFLSLYPKNHLNHEKNILISRFGIGGLIS